MLAFLVLPACGRLGSRRGVDAAWPLFYRNAQPGRLEFEALGPFVYYQREGKATACGLRPFFTYERGPGGRRLWGVLYPLAHFSQGDQCARRFVFPFYFHYWRVRPNGERVSASVIFPLFWWGNDGGKKWFFVPFVYGKCRGLFGVDEIAYVGFLMSRVKSGPNVTHSILWPFVSWTRGPERWGIRIWPFFGYTTRKGRWWNGYILWPFFTYGAREASEMKAAAKYFCFWPFFGYSRTRDGNAASYSILWPFFYFAWNKRAGMSEWRAPFPLLSHKTTKGVKKVMVWPFFSRRTFKGGSDGWFLANLIRYSRLDGKRKKVRTFRVYPFFGRSWSADPEGERSFWLLWPLFRRRSYRKGDVRWGDANSLQLAWFQNPETFDRNWNALFGLFESERRRDGSRATRLLWRLLRFEHGPGWSHVQLGPLVSWQRADGLTRVSVMLGLVETGVREGRRGWRLFYVPVGGSPSVPPRQEAGHGG